MAYCRLPSRKNSGTSKIHSVGFPEQRISEELPAYLTGRQLTGGRIGGCEERVHGVLVYQSEPKGVDSEHL